MTTSRTMVSSLGNEAPILADGRRAPDRREISLRWLSGTFLTGITSSILMGVALFAALDGRQQLAIPAEAFAALPRHDAESVSRGKRLLGGKIIAKPTGRKVMEVATLVKEGNREIVRRQPFSHVRMTLAAYQQSTNDDYPPFDPLNIFSTGERNTDEAAPATGVLYGSKVDSEVSLQMQPFPIETSKLPYAPGMSLDEVEENVRTNGSVLTSGATQVASLYYVDPQRFEGDEPDLSIGIPLSARIVEENISVANPEPINEKSRDYAEDVIPVRRETTILDAMTAVGYPKEQATVIADNLGQSLDAKAALQTGDVLRIGLIQEGDLVSVIRASLYRKGNHQATVALDDDRHYVRGSEPPHLDAVDSAFSEDIPVVSPGRDLPRIYDGIYRAALSYGMTTDMTALVVKLLASTVDLQAQLKPTDLIEAFFSAVDESGAAGPNSELLYVNARFGDTVTRFYRFQNPDDNSVDYFDQDGKSIRQFLLRNPVPNGRLTSGFGMRRHPILGFSRMHTGTDWAASRGTPIIATGNGIVEKAGWASGYGNQTIIRHTNGYESSYNHQSAIAKNVREGARITQGQVIGYVGSTGSSTGAHLHYELIVNGTKVDAMKVRLPGGKSLAGTSLARFSEERKRIDTLLTPNGQADQLAAR